MKTILLVFLGGGLGSAARFLASKILTADKFPLGTFAVNILGCFLIGLLTGLFSKNVISQDVKMFLTVGFCGGFTTFSTFMNENLSLMKAGDFAMSALYLTVSVLTGFLAVWAGGKIVD